MLEGRKSYIVAIAIGVFGVLQYFGIVIPEYIWTILGALGLGAIRDAINHIKK
jgi:hypothetical protein